MMSGMREIFNLKNTANFRKDEELIKELIKKSINKVSHEKDIQMYENI